MEMTPQPSAVESVAAAAAAAVPVVAGDMSKAAARSLLAKARKDARFDEEGEYRVYQELLEGKTTRFVSRVMYDGTNYRGFQLQNNGQPTVQVRKAAAMDDEGLAWDFRHVRYISEIILIFQVQ